MKYVGICFDSGAWGKDLTGLLVGEFEDGWKVAGSHISSDASWAQIDIRGHFDRLEIRQPDDTYEWLGRMDVPAIEERFGWTRPAEEQPIPA